MNDKDPIFDLFKKAENEINLQPSKNSWIEIERKLNKHRKHHNKTPKLKLNLIYILGAIGIIFPIIILIFLLNSKPNLKNNQEKIIKDTINIDSLKIDSLKNLKKK